MKLARIEMLGPSRLAVGVIACADGHRQRISVGAEPIETVPTGEG